MEDGKVVLRVVVENPEIDPETGIIINLEQLGMENEKITPPVIVENPKIINITGPENLVKPNTNVEGNTNILDPEIIDMMKKLDGEPPEWQGEWPLWWSSEKQWVWLRETMFTVDGFHPYWELLDGAFGYIVEDDKASWMHDVWNLRGQN